MAYANCSDFPTPRVKQFPARRTDDLRTRSELREYESAEVVGRRDNRGRREPPRLPAVRRGTCHTPPEVVPAGRAVIRRAGARAHAQRCEDVALQIRRKGFPADDFDDTSEDLVIGTRVDVQAARLRGQTDVAERGDMLGQRCIPGGGTWGVGRNPTGLVQQVTHGDEVR